MAVKKNKGIQTVHIPRTHDGREIKPVRYVRFGGASIMAGAYKDTGDMILDSNGKVIPFHNI